MLKTQIDSHININKLVLVINDLNIILKYTKANKFQKTYIIMIMK